MPRLLLVALLLVPLAGLAQTPVYRTTDKDGNVVFTDAPPAGTDASERVEVQRTNTTPPPPELPEPAPAPAEEPKAKVPEVFIVEPPNETTIPMGPGNFSVSAKVKGKLGPSQGLQLFIDGVPQGPTQASSNWMLSNVFRGAHDLTVSVIDANGEAIATSDPVRVYVLRPSVNFSKRPLEYIAK